MASSVACNSPEPLKTKTPRTPGTPKTPSDGLRTPSPLRLFGSEFDLLAKIQNVIAEITRFAESPSSIRSFRYCTKKRPDFHRHGFKLQNCRRVVDRYYSVNKFDKSGNSIEANIWIKKRIECVGLGDEPDHIYWILTIVEPMSDCLHNQQYQFQQKGELCTFLNENGFQAQNLESDFVLMATLESFREYYFKEENQVSASFIETKMPDGKYYRHGAFSLPLSNDDATIFTLFKAQVQHGRSSILEFMRQTKQDWLVLHHINKEDLSAYHFDDSIISPQKMEEENNIVSKLDEVVISQQELDDQVEEDDEMIPDNLPDWVKKIIKKTIRETRERKVKITTSLRPDAPKEEPTLNQLDMERYLALMAAEDEEKEGDENSQ